MSRTLTAANTAEPRRRYAYPKFEEDVFGLILSCCDELWTIGKRHKDLAPKLARLNAQLDDPALADHPKHGEALARYWTWKTELTTIEERADRLTENLSKHLDRLPPARLAVWRAVEGWPEAWTGEEIARWVWNEGRTERLSLLAAPF